MLTCALQVPGSRLTVEVPLHDNSLTAGSTRVAIHLNWIHKKLVMALRLSCDSITLGLQGGHIDKLEGPEVKSPLGLATQGRELGLQTN